MDELRFCIKCGHELVLDALFCPYCGTRITESTDSVSRGAIYEHIDDNSSDIESKARWEGQVSSNILTSRSSFENESNLKTGVLPLQGIDIINQSGIYSFRINGIVQEQAYSLIEVWKEWAFGYVFWVKQLGGDRHRALLNFSRKDNSLKRITDYIFPDVPLECHCLLARSDKEWDYDYVFGGQSRHIQSVWPALTERPYLIAPLSMNSVDNISSKGEREAWLVLQLERDYPILCYYELKKKSLVVYTYYDAVGIWKWDLWGNNPYWTNK